MTPIKPEEVPNIKGINDIERLVDVINHGLLSNKTSFNNVLDEMAAGEEELNEVAERFRNVGWKVEVFEDNYHTYTISFRKK